MTEPRWFVAMSGEVLSVAAGGAMLGVNLAGFQGAFLGWAFGFWLAMSNTPNN